MRIVLDDYESDYDILLRKRGKVIMKIKRLGVLAKEVFKTVNNLNPNYMKDIFTPKLHPKVRPNDILFKHHKCIRDKKNTYGALLLLLLLLLLLPLLFCKRIRFPKSYLQIL